MSTLASASPASSAAPASSLTATPGAFEACVLRAVVLRRDPAAWQAVMRRGMSQNLSWAGPARDYMALYAQALASRARGARRSDAL